MILRIERLRALLPGLDRSPAEIADALSLAGAEAVVLDGDDPLVETDITTNRPDLLSYVGVARELAALFELDVVPPAADIAGGATSTADAIRVEIEDATACPRYSARVIRGLRIAPSPAWLVREVEAAGIRAISNVVDVTNFVLLELGHPLHAFDLTTIGDARILVRRPRAGETLETLDGIERELSSDDLVIADGHRAIALAGVMGGAATEIRDDSTDLLLESAYFDPLTVRRMAQRHGLRTEASQRFERGADPAATVRALDRAASLIVELAGGELLDGVVDAQPGAIEPRRVDVRPARINRILGTEVPLARVRSILERLGFGVGADGESVAVTVPTWRPDIEREIDLIEEVGRQYGYHHLPAELPTGQSRPRGRSRGQRRLQLARSALEGAGWSEAVTLSMVEPEREQRLHPEVEPVRLRNPLSDRASALRTTVTGGLLESASHNIRHGAERCRLYEVAHVFRRGDDGAIDERTHLALVAAHRNLSAGDAALEVKGALERVATQLRLGPIAVSGDRLPVAVRFAERPWGRLSQVDPDLLARYEMDRDLMVVAGEVDLGLALDHDPGVPRYVPFGRFPTTSRDISLWVGDATYAAVIALIETVRAPLLDHIRFVERYVDRKTKRRSLTLRLVYASSERTLAAEEVDRAHADILEALAADDRLELRIA